ncbi:MAG: hypothetical protein J5876_04980 [Lachnospiraceae bacterium]|nr:hypothetical protein [Lachnospiraceae bacterium]
MLKKSAVLLKTMIRANSTFNILRHEKDKKKKRKMIGGLIGIGMIYLMIIIYACGYSALCGYSGMAYAVPASVGVILFAMNFIFTFFKADGYLFAFKDYDMTMSLPLSVKSIVGTRFLRMYILNLPYSLLVSASMILGYAIYEKVDAWRIIVWIVGTFMIQLVAMVLASILSALIAGIGTKFKFKKIARAILTFAFCIFCFSLRYIIDATVAKDSAVMIDKIDMFNSGVNRYLFPAKWFDGAVSDYSVWQFILLVVVSIAIYELFAYVLSKFYRQINTRLMSEGGNRRKTKAKHIGKKSAVNTIAHKEFKRLVSSNNYFVNMCMGHLLVLIMVIALIVFGVDKIINVIVEGAPVTKEMIIPIIPIIVHFLVGMATTTACSYSLEGKSYWILQSLPIKKSTVVKGKMAFQLYLSLPFEVFGNLALAIACHAKIYEVILFAICGAVLGLFAATYGMYCNVSHVNFEWTNEMEVIKQSVAVTLYVLPNMFIMMILGVAVIFLGRFIHPDIEIMAITIIYMALAVLFYKGSIRKAERI